MTRPSPGGKAANTAATSSGPSRISKPPPERAPGHPAGTAETASVVQIKTVLS